MSKTSRQGWMSTVLALGGAFVAGCASEGKSEERPIEKKITMPEDPVADGRARAAAAMATEILAERVELYLPPGLYSEVEITVKTHVKDEFETALGRRITLRPPEPGLRTTPPARVHVGKWRLAARGKIDVLFAQPDGGPAARIQAFGVDLFHRNGESKRGLPLVEIEDGTVKTPGLR